MGLSGLEIYKIEQVNKEENEEKSFSFIFLLGSIWLMKKMI